MRWVRGAAIPLLVLVLWEMFSRSGELPMDTFSRPSQIATALGAGLADGSVFRATWQTFEAALVGFAIAAVCGVFLGVVLGLAPRLEGIVGPSIEVLRPIPSVALIPLSLLIFGFGLSMEAAVVVFACIWPVLIVTTAAVRGIEPRLLEVSQALQLSFGERVRKIVLPAALPRISVGLRVAVAIALVVAVTVEIVLNPRGLGYTMIMAQQQLAPAVMYAQLVWLGLFGWGLNALLERALARWPGGTLPGRGS